MSIPLFTVGSLVNVDPEAHIGRRDSDGGTVWILDVKDDVDEDGFESKKYDVQCSTRGRSWMMYYQHDGNNNNR